MKSDFSTKLQALRAAKKVNQCQAARELGISQALLSHYEHGAREPRMEFIVKAGAYYGVSTDYLLGRGDVSGGPAGSSEIERLGQTISLLFAVLAELADEGLCASAAGYLGIAALNIFEALSRAEFQYDPMRDAALKAAEASMRTDARRALGADGQKYTYEALESRHPKFYAGLSEMSGKVSESVSRLKISYDIG